MVRRPFTGLGKEVFDFDQPVVAVEHKIEQQYGHDQLYENGGYAPFDAYHPEIRGKEIGTVFNKAQKERVLQNVQKPRDQTKKIGPFFKMKIQGQAYEL